MYRLCWLTCILVGTTTAFGQVAPKPKTAPPEPGFLIEALNHASPAIRLRAAQLLTDEKINATPRKKSSRRSRDVDGSDKAD